MSLIHIPIMPPVGGVYLDPPPEQIPPEGAAKLTNVCVCRGQIFSRDGYVDFLATPAALRVIDLFNLQFADGSTEVLRCDENNVYKYDTSSSPSVWTAITGVTWSGNNDERFWAVRSPWGSETKGRIIVGNGYANTPASWTGGGGTFSAVSGAAPAKYAVVGPDNRLFLANIKVGGNNLEQDIMWSKVLLPDAASTDWTGPGSGQLSLRNDSWPISAIWVQAGRIFVGKSRSIAVLNPTGVANNAYGYSVITTNGEGVLAGLVQFGNVAAFLSESGFMAFDSASVVPLPDQNHHEMQDRLNYDAFGQVTGLVDRVRGRVGWGLPLDGSSTPTEIWWFDYRTKAWQIDLIPHTAMSRFSAIDTTFIDELNPAPSGYIDNFGGGVEIDELSDPATEKPEIIFGREDGSTKKITDDVHTDSGATITGEWVSGAVPFLNHVQRMVGSERQLTTDSHIVVDQVTLSLVDRGSDYTLEVSVSSDGGATFTALGTISLTSTHPESARRLVMKKVSKRISVRDRIQIRVTNTTSNTPWGITGAVISIDAVGRKL